jgi:hypothetical protein
MRSYARMTLSESSFRSASFPWKKPSALLFQKWPRAKGASFPASLASGVEPLPVRRKIEAQIEIDASAGAVWKVLTDFCSYASWNPVIRRIEGTLAVGSSLRVVACLPCGLPMLLQPRLLEFEVERKIRWVGGLFVRGLLDGEHVFMLEPLGKTKVRFVQSEEYSGVFLPIMWKWLGNQGLGAFKMMNMALKDTSERLRENSS